jgi:hypothetical protein
MFNQERHIQTYGKLESDCSGNIDSINESARKTKRFIDGRGIHGMKHNFAQLRKIERVSHCMTPEETLRRPSIETSHFRMSETLT